jgi:hypothetical protein
VAGLFAANLCASTLRRCAKISNSDFVDTSGSSYNLCGQTSFFFFFRDDNDDDDSFGEDDN